MKVEVVKYGDGHDDVWVAKLVDEYGNATRGRGSSSEQAMESLKRLVKQNWQSAQQALDAVEAYEKEAQGETTT